MASVMSGLRGVHSMPVSRAVAAVLGLSAFAAVATEAAPARADDERGVLASRHQHYESPQNFAVELRFSRYQPSIDGDPGLNGATPYQNTFGTMPRLEIGFEFDWQVLRIPHFGTLGPGASIGYTTMTAPAYFTDGSGASAENTSLEIVPLYAVGVLRVDVFSREAHIPLVPYAKLGLGLAYWRAYNDGGTSVSKDSVVGKGHSTGSHIALGVALTLDDLDGNAARNLDTSMGVNHTYIFGEYFRSDLSGLAQEHSLNVGTSNFAGGLAFEF